VRGGSTQTDRDLLQGLRWLSCESSCRRQGRGVQRGRETGASARRRSTAPLLLCCSQPPQRFRHGKVPWRLAKMMSSEDISHPPPRHLMDWQTQHRCYNKWHTGVPSGGCTASVTTVLLLVCTFGRDGCCTQASCSYPATACSPVGSSKRSTPTDLKSPRVVHGTLTSRFTS
jgi:hypothetical protein